MDEDQLLEFLLFDYEDTDVDQAMVFSSLLNMDLGQLDDFWYLAVGHNIHYVLPIIDWVVHIKIRDYTGRDPKGR